MKRAETKTIVLFAIIALLLSLIVVVINLTRFSIEILILDVIILLLTLVVFFGLFLPTLQAENTIIAKQENELRRGQSVLQTTLKGLPIGLMYINEKERVEWFNDPWKEWMNVASNQLAFQDFASFPTLYATLNKVIALETKESLVFTNKLLTIDVSIIPIHEQNRFNGVLLIGNDISHRQYYERIQDKFMADLTHEIKTPLTSIISISEMLQSKKLDNEKGKREEFEKLLLEEALRVNRLIDRLTELRQYKNYYLRSIKTRVNVYQLIKDCFNLNAPLLEQKNLKTIINIDPMLTMFVDGDKFRQVFLNLMSNAIRYTQQGHIEVEATVDKDNLTIWFRDTGSGIEEEYLTRIFDRFFRTDYARTRFEGGSGLGLAITKEIIKSHKGTISVKSKVGVGTEFCIILPNLE